jgi:hypothetical protein
MDMAIVLSKLGRSADARAHAQSALAAFRALAAADPKIAEYRQDIGRALAGLADLEEQEGHPQQAIALLQESLGEMTVPTDADPGIAYAALARAHAESLLANAYAALASDARRPAAERSQDRDNACSSDRRALVLLERLRTSWAEAAELAGQVRGRMQSCDAVALRPPR